jgi:hypothetical protein
MGSLNLPVSGLIYLDTSTIIYSNDPASRRVTGLNVVVLSELI